MWPCRLNPHGINKRESQFLHPIFAQLWHSKPFLENGRHRPAESARHTLQIAPDSPLLPTCGIRIADHPRAFPQPHVAEKPMKRLAFGIDSPDFGLLAVPRRQQIARGFSCQVGIGVLF